MIITKEFVTYAKRRKIMSFYKLMFLQMQGLFGFILYTREEGDSYSITC